MGMWMSSLFGSFFNAAPARVCMVGLDGAGKTTILYKLKLGEVVHTIPTIGFNVEEVKMRTLSMTVWDIGGQTKIRYNQATATEIQQQKCLSKAF